MLTNGYQNNHLGKNLHLHPCNMVSAICKEETRSWEGAIISAYGSEFEDLDGKGHGVKLEPMCSVVSTSSGLFSCDNETDNIPFFPQPYAVLAQQMWHSGLDAKLLQLRYGHMINFISLTRDRDTGEVFPDPETGAPRMVYKVSEFDRENAMSGVQALAKLCYVSGAREIRPLIAGIAPFSPARRPDEGEQSPLDDGKSVKDPELEDPKFAAWLLELRQIGNQTPEAAWSSAHQMGTCRMGKTAEDGVVDENGKVWGREGLYVADSSVLPSASEVSPMITTLALADWISRGLVKEMER